MVKDTNLCRKKEMTDSVALNFHSFKVWKTIFLHQFHFPEVDKDEFAIWYLATSNDLLAQGLMVTTPLVNPDGEVRKHTVDVIHG